MHVSAPKSSTGVDANKLGAAAPRYAVVVASTPVVDLKDQRKAPIISNPLPTSVTSESDSSVYSSASDPSLSTNVQENKDVSGDSVVLELPKSEKVASKSANHVIKEKTQSDNAKAIGKNRHTKSSQPPSSSTHDGSQAILPSNSDGQLQLESTDALKGIVTCYSLNVTFYRHSITYSACIEVLIRHKGPQNFLIVSLIRVTVALFILFFLIKSNFGILCSTFLMNYVGQ